VDERLHFVRHADDRFLDGIFGFLVAQAGPNRCAVNELPISIKEFAPTSLIIEVAQPVDERMTSGEELFDIVVRSFFHRDERTIARKGGDFTEKSSLPVKQLETAI